ncbi:MAG: TRAM domain-containing protein, partial [Ignavibacteriaceae bacterium]|nr:TRAM domain-containing protein [Ignavibacteriaceae bacterium]
SDKFLSGRTDSNKVVIIPLDERIKTGVYVKAKIDRATSATLFGEFTGFANLLEEHLSLTG